ncbi:MAG: methyltransferase [Chloroflexi bacterium]|nr:methyltransferase [Chloroflexota bacterium]
MTDYYSFRETQLEVRGRQLVVVGKPGVWSWDRINPGTAALLEVVDVQPFDRVLDLGCGTGVVGAFAAFCAVDGAATLIDANCVAVACAKRTVEANRLSNASVSLSDGACGLSVASFDLALSHLPRGRAVQDALIRGAARVLRPGGRLYLVASKQAGIKPAIAYARELFGQCAVIRQKKGYHVAVASRPLALQISLSCDDYVAHTVELDRERVVMFGTPGVFAWDRLDPGTAALVRTMMIAPDDRVLDLGCGTGIAGLFAARRAHRGQVALVDSDVRATESACRTLSVNDVGNAEVLLSDCASAVLDREFDVVVTNPPFHQGIGVDYDVAYQFVRDAIRVLRAGGRLFLVANRHLRYEPIITEVFGNVETAFSDQRYVVLTAVAQRNATG